MEKESPEELLARFRLKTVDQSPFSRFLGVELLSCWAGECEFTIPVRPEITQHRGTVHGGIIGVLADNACCWAAASVVGELVTANYTLHLVAPARGTLLRAKGKVVSAGRNIATARAEIFSEDADGTTLVGTALAALAVRQTTRIASAVVAESPA